MPLRQDTANVQASNRLYNGEVTDFREAMQLVIEGMAAEARETQRWNASLAPDEQQYRWDTDIHESYSQTAQTALRIYREEVEAAEQRVLERLRALAASNEGQRDQYARSELESIADALETGDYSRLAW